MLNSKQKIKFCSKVICFFGYKPANQVGEVSSQHCNPRLWGFLCFFHKKTWQVHQQAPVPAARSRPGGTVLTQSEHELELPESEGSILK